ncbi:MAG: hypothetical protein AB1626_02630 [Candidatus Micrarchaeota archaeon]
MGENESRALDALSRKIRDLSPELEEITYAFPGKNSPEHHLHLVFSRASSARVFAQRFDEEHALRPHLRIAVGERPFKLSIEPHSDDGEALCAC